MVDIHAHVAPALDDGSDSIEESLLMLQSAAQSGTKSLVVTPHYLNRAQCRFDVRKADIENAFSLLLKETEKAEIPIELFLGAEHFGVTDIERIAERGELLPINGSRYLLVEFDFDDDIHRARFVLSSLCNAGFVPIIAHPERYSFLSENPSEAYSFLEKGCLFQVNKGSPLGRYGPAARRVSNWLLENRLVHFVASDCHSPYRRTPDLSAAHELLTYRLGSDYTDRIFTSNGLRVLQNESVAFG